MTMRIGDKPEGAPPSHRPLKLAPSILTADLGRLAEAIQAAEAAGVDYIHLDVMDGHFVPNLTIGPAIVEAVRKATTLPLDIHMMVTNPETLVHEFASAGANSITVHQEVCFHLQRQIHQIKDLGLSAGVALNPATPLATVEEVVDDLDLLLIMSVNPGFGGQSFIPNTLPRLRRARALLDAHGSSAGLQVDGGVGAANIATVAGAGATIFVVGSATFNPRQSVAEAIRGLRAALGQVGER